jgi:DNA-binding GntR family transcriptional regulator
MPRSRGEELNEFAYGRIKRMILDNELKPGEKIRQEDLAGRIGVSRTPVLAALSRLEQEMLVSIEPRRGASVVEFSAEDLLKIVDIRLRLEPLGAREAAINASELEILRLKGIIEDFARAVDDDDRVAEKGIDYDFHFVIHEMSKNTFLHRLIASMNLIGVSNLKGLITPASLSLEAHRAIYEALQERDPNGAEEAMAHHLENTRAKLLTSIEESLRLARTNH